MVLDQGSPGSAGPRAQPCHLCWSSSTPGKLPPRAVFAFTCPVCKRARRGRFQSQPQNSGRFQPAFPAPRNLTLLQGRGCRHPQVQPHSHGLAWAAPAVRWQRDARVSQGTATLSSDAFPFCAARAAGKERAGKGEGKSSHHLDPRSFSFPEVPNLQRSKDTNPARIKLHLPGS